MTVGRLDRAAPLKARITSEGFLKAKSIVTRTGVFLYQNSDGSLRRELRHPDDVFHADSLETMKMLPITDDHPKQKIVTSENFKDLVIGYTGETIELDGAHVITNLIISDSKAIKTVKDFGKRELSLGYSTDLVADSGIYEGQPYDYRQTNIKYNHLSLVDRARAGAKARIHLDSGDAIQIQQIKGSAGYPDESFNNGEKQMEEKMTTIVLDHVDYKVPSEVSKAFQDEKKRADANETTMSEMKSKMDCMLAEVETLKAERDGLRQKLDTANVNSDESVIAERVKERRSFEKVADKVLAKDVNIDSMSNIDIQKAVITAKFPKQTLDGKSNEYLKALYDVAIEDIQSAPADLSKKMVAVDSEESKDFMSALKAAQENQRKFLETNYKR